MGSPTGHNQVINLFWYSRGHLYIHRKTTIAQQINFTKIEVVKTVEERMIFHVCLCISSSTQCKSKSVFQQTLRSIKVKSQLMMKKKQI